MPQFPSMSGGYWEAVNFYCTQGIRQSLSWLKMDLTGHQLEVLTAWASPQLWHFDDNQGRSMTSRGNNSFSQSLLSHQHSPSPRDTVLADFLCPEACVLIISDKASSESPGMGPTAACFLSQAVPAICPSALHGSAGWEDLIWGKQRQIWTCPKAGLDRPRQMVLRISGLGEAVKINHLKIVVFPRKCHQLDTWRLKYRKGNMARMKSPGFRTVLKAFMCWRCLSGNQNTLIKIFQKGWHSSDYSLLFLIQAENVYQALVFMY